MHAILLNLKHCNKNSPFNYYIGVFFNADVCWVFFRRIYLKCSTTLHYYTLQVEHLVLY